MLYALFLPIAWTLNLYRSALFPTGCPTLFPLFRRLPAEDSTPFHRPPLENSRALVTPDNSSSMPRSDANDQQRARPQRQRYDPSDQDGRSRWDYNRDWPDEYHRWNGNYGGRPRPDSGYGSGYSAYDGMKHWGARANQYLDELEAFEKDLDTAKERTQMLEKQLKETENSLKDEARRCKKAEDISIKLTKQNDRLQFSLVEQLLRTGSWSLAIKEAEALIQTRSDELQVWKASNTRDNEGLARAQKALRAAEFCKAQALSSSGKDTEAIELLRQIFNDRHRLDVQVSRSDTRETHLLLCTLLQTSSDKAKWNEALRYTDQVLGPIRGRPDSIDLPWVVQNRILHVKLLLSLKHYKEIADEVRKILSLKQDCTQELRKAVDKCTNTLTTKLHEATQHRVAHQLTLATLTPETKLSTTALTEILTFPASDLIKTWTAFSILNSTERRRLGFEIAARLGDLNHKSDAVKMLTQLPSTSPSSTQLPSQVNVDNLRSQFLIDLPSSSQQHEGAKIAMAFFKEYAFRPLPDRSRAYHVETILTAINKLSRSIPLQPASHRAKLFNSLADEYWYVVFEKAKKVRAGTGAGSIPPETLSLIGKSGRMLRDTWKEDCGQRLGRIEAMHPERKARDRLQKLVKEAEAWVPGTA